MINALKKSEINQKCKIDVTKASEKLGKVLNEADIRLLVDNMVKKDGADMYVSAAILSILAFICCFFFPL